VRREQEGATRAGPAEGLCAFVLLFRVASFTSWCGHGQELIPVREKDGWVRFIPIVGKAT